MREALFRVKKELGPDAVILHTRTAQTSGFMGLGRHSYVEILASRDVGFVSSVPVAPRTAAPAPAAEESRSVRPHPPAPEVDKTLARYNSDLLLLKDDIMWIRSTLSDLSKRQRYFAGSGVPEEMMDLYMYLLEQEVAEELAMELVQSIHEEVRRRDGIKPQDIRQLLHTRIAALLEGCEPVKLVDGYNMKIALIGPTGVGKTTTIAKLAAEFSLVQKKKVSVITIDTYRIAAVDQIRTYMDIIDIPLEVVTTPKEMKDAVDRQRNSDVILIDTAGRSQKNTQQIAELKSFLRAAEPDEVHLVLSTTANYKTTMDTIESFNAVSVDKLLFTKLDEAVNFGIILNVAARVGKRLSYVTTGQVVPDDIEPARGLRLAEMMAGGFSS